MGAGASMEGDGQSVNPNSAPPSRVQSARSSMRSHSRRGSQSSLATWRSAFKSSRMPPSNLRKMRAAALGRKSACTVGIDKTGFTLQHIRICEGQSVTWEWEAPPDTQGFNVTQVVHDGEGYRPVIGGFNSGPLAVDGYHEQQFNLAGEYKFVSAGIKCTPLKVEVFPRKEIEVSVTDNGFKPHIVRIDEGNAISWAWSECDIPHTCIEVKFSHRKGCLVSKDNIERPIPTKAGNVKRDFPKSGIFYFQTEGISPGVMHTCVVHVRERQREYKVDVSDREFLPPILVIQEGDRVWWHWDKNKCQNLHCVYQIEHPPITFTGDESFKPYKNGFKWPNPSKNGILSHEFYEAGVYYYSDHNFNEAAEYIGTIIVQPKQVEHFIELTPEGFSQDLIYAETGDRIWWAWKHEDMRSAFLIQETDKVVSALASRPSLEEDGSGEGSYMDEELEQMKLMVELDTIQLGSIGCYHFKLSDTAVAMSSFSVNVQGGPRNHTVHVTDNGFEPKVVTIHPGDRVWWIWQDTKKQHNIIQVSHQGNHIRGGFCSGAATDAPSAYMNQFQYSGVCYYISSGISKAFGAVVVSSQPKVYEIQVTGTGINPDPVVIASNDVVAWTFKGLRQHDVVQVSTVDQLFDAQFNSPNISPRRQLSRMLTEQGVHHFTSKSFLKASKKDQQRQNDETRVSSILVDDVNDSMIVRVGAQGFFPQAINIRKGQSVLWTWKESGKESHNIIHVNSPESDKPLSVIQGGKSFNSGRPVPNNSFLYTFDEPGNYCVASQGAPGFAGNVQVMQDADKVDTPRIISDRTGGTVERGHVVKLEVAHGDAAIYYTLDGTAPELHKLSPKQYNLQKGILLKNPGLCFVRAVAVAPNALNSDIFTSKRFWVLSSGEEAPAPPSPEHTQQLSDTKAQSQMYEWWSCVPVIKGCFTGPGVMEIFWDPPPQAAVHIIHGYQIYLNGVSYCQVFPSNHNSLNIAGVAGGRMYEVELEVFPKDTMYLPHKSNKLAMKSPKTTPTGGPLVSMETTPKEDMLAIVWMAISTPEVPMSGYRVYLNGQMCGSQVVPDDNSDRCKVVIEGCGLQSPYRIQVAAVPTDGSAPKMSNELEVTLPLDISSIRLPSQEVRLDDEDLYKEYIEVREGSGYVTSQAGPSETPEAPVQTLDLTQEASLMAQPQPAMMSKPPVQHIPAPATPTTPAQLSDITEDYEGDSEYPADVYEDTGPPGLGEEITEPGYNQSEVYHEAGYEAAGYTDVHEIDQGMESNFEEEEDDEDDGYEDEPEEEIPEYQEGMRNYDVGKPRMSLEYGGKGMEREEVGKYEALNRKPSEEVLAGGRPEPKPLQSAGHQDSVGSGLGHRRISQDGSIKRHDSIPYRKASDESLKGTPLATSSVNRMSGDWGGQQMAAPGGLMVPSIAPAQSFVNADGTSSYQSMGHPLGSRRPSASLMAPSQTAVQAQSFVNSNAYLPPPTPTRAPSKLASPAMTEVQTSMTYGLPVTSVAPGQMPHTNTPATQEYQGRYSIQTVNNAARFPFHVPQAPSQPPQLHGNMPYQHYLTPFHAAISVQQPLPPDNYSPNYLTTPSPTPSLSQPAHLSLSPNTDPRLSSGDQSPHQPANSSGYYSGVGGGMAQKPVAMDFQPRAAQPAYSPGPMIQGVKYHSHVMAGYGAPPPEPTPENYIDTMQAPWDPHIKGGADMPYVPHGVSLYGKPPLPPAHGALTSRTSDSDLYAPRPGVAVEVQDDSVETDSSDAMQKPPARSRKSKRKKKSAVIEVQEEAHLHVDQGSQQVVPVKEEMSGVVSAVPILGAQDGQDQLLPPPIVSVQSAGNDTAWVRWHFDRDPGPMYRIMVNVVNIMGKRFAKSVNSNISFECLMEEGNDAVTGVQHCWNVTEGNEYQVKGLMPGMVYRIFVVANYSLVNSAQPAELQAKSVTLKYTTLGPPPPPTLKPLTLDLGQVTLQWDASEGHKDVPTTGFRVLVDGKPLGAVLSPQTHKTTIDNLHPGQTIQVCVVATTNHALGDSDPSNTVRVTCPAKPPPVSISQQPSYKKGSVIVAWEKPSSGKQVPFGEDIHSYKIFLDGIWHGEVKSSASCNRNGYQYFLTELAPGRPYDVQVRCLAGQGGVDLASDTAHVTLSMQNKAPPGTYSGQRRADPDAEHVFCLSESDASNIVPVMAPAPPTSPCLRLEGMHADGIDITWEMPQQFGDAEISGYQLMKDEKMYGSIMPPDVHSLRIKDCTLGDRIQLQILALTDHPVGRDGKAIKEQQKDDNNTEAGDSGIADTQSGVQELYLGDRYSNCKPGPKLVVHYTGLVQPPSKVWCERVTGHSAMIVWSKSEKPRHHFVAAESYQVTWWPKDSNEEINSQATKDDHLLVSGMKPNTNYNVVVEARKMHSYKDIQEGDVPDDGYGNTFILTGKSEHINLRTVRPPSAPTNLGVLASTCHSVMVGWDPPHESGIEIIGIRVDAMLMKSTDRQNHSSTEVKADATTAILENLCEKSEYMVTVTAITDEFFEQLPEGHDLRRTRALPLNKTLPDDSWLPSSSMIAMTSGTDPPSEVRIISTTVNSVTIMWSPPVVYGSNRLTGTVVRWAEGKFSRPSTNDSLAHHKSIVADCNEALIEDLAPGILYKIIVEAIVSVKAAIDYNRKDPDIEKQNRRTTHVLSKPIFVRTRAPCEQPKPIVSAYTSNTIQLSWEKPLLYSVIGKDDNGHPKYLKLALEGYRLEINGKPHMRLVSAAQSCTLVKCKPGKTYKIVLVALTCTDDVKKERKRRLKSSGGGGGSSMGGSQLNLSMSSMNSSNKEWETMPEDLENDESHSQPLEVTLPNAYDGMLTELSAMYKLPNSSITDDYSGDIHIEWSMCGDSSNVSQFKVVWNCLADKSSMKKNISPSQHHCTIPVSKKKCFYDVRVKPQYKSKETVPHDAQSVTCLIPGSPDPPEIFTRSIGRDEFIIEWGEPRLYGVKIEGYQVYLNGKKVGGMLSSSHRKAVIPCKPKRSYKVNLVALTGDPNFPDTQPSNTLLITTGNEDGTRYLDSTASGIIQEPPMEESHDQDDSDMRVRITKITENTVHLDWVTFSEPEGMLYYKVTWSSLVDPEEKEVKLPAGEKSCVLHKCYPGAVHYMRVFAMGKDERVLDVSKNLTVQTSAPPDCPRLTQRACNFRYIAIEWEKPKTYGDADISGYKVYVNGVVESSLGPDQFSYSYTAGKWCREYAFQVQALTAADHLNSKPSEPLVITWPGVQAPVLRRAPAVSGNSIKVTWDPPTFTEGVSIKCYKVVCLEEATEKTVQVVGSIHPNTCEAEIHNLKPGAYVVFLEVHLHGSNDVVRSDALKIRPEITPDPPQITVTVIGLEERRSIEKITCDLINKRDRLQNFLHNSDMLQNMRLVDEEQVISKVTEDLTHVEDMLDDCLSSLANYTGHLLAHVSWTCPQSNTEIVVSGFKVLVDGKQYGTTLHSAVKNVRIKLGLNQQSHNLSLVSTCDRPQTTSAQSNIVELLTEPFQPFTFFMFLDNKIQNIGYSYADTLESERKFSQGLINQGLMRRHVAPPSCSIMEVFTGEYRPLFPPSGPRCFTAMLFWTRWNVASKRALGWFVRFAKQNYPEFEFIAVCCTRGEMHPGERQETMQTITKSSWRDDRCVRHVGSHTAAPIADPSGVMLDDLAELFGMVGTPMLSIVHPEDYVAWKGRYCAFDYNAFEVFMKFVLAQSMGKSPPVSDPWDNAIDVDALDGVSKRSMNESQMLIHRPQATKGASPGGTTTHHVNGRPRSGKKLFYKTNVDKNKKDRINVNARPYSASSVSSDKSPYSQKIVGQPRRVRSGRKSKGY